MEQCPYCKKYLLACQRQEHKCDAPLVDVKEIPVIFFYELLTKDSRKIVIARGFDGVLYLLIQSRNPLSDDSYHDNESDEKLPEPKKLIIERIKL